MKNIFNNQRLILLLIFIFLSLLSKIGRTEEGSNIDKKFSIKLTGGLGYITNVDNNKIMDSLNEWYLDVGEMLGMPVSGEFDKINFGYDFETELIIKITPKWGINLGGGYFQGEKKSIINIGGGVGINSLKYKITVIPVKLGGYYFLPITSKINFFLNGGINYYFAQLLLDFKQEISPENYWVKEISDFNSNGFGFFSGIGVEYNISKQIAIVIEGYGRSAEIKPFKGLMKRYNNEGYKEEIEGTLYIYESEIYGKWRLNFWAFQEKPNNPAFRNIREAVLNLNGFSLRIGIKIKAF